MSFSELLFALLLVSLLCVVGVMTATVAGIGRRSEAHAAELAELRAQLSLGGRAQEAAASELRDRLEQTQTPLGGVRAGFVAPPPPEEGARQSLRPPEAISPRRPT